VKCKEEKVRGRERLRNVVCGKMVGEIVYECLNIPKKESGVWGIIKAR
jgi:hypothetical protein